jgi:hypothetical protein
MKWTNIKIMEIIFNCIPTGTLGAVGQMRLKQVVIETACFLPPLHNLYAKLLTREKGRKQEKNLFFWYDSAINIHVFMLGN